MKVKHLVTMLQCVDQDLEVAYGQGTLSAVRSGDAENPDQDILRINLNDGSFEVHHGFLGVMIGLSMATVHGKPREEDGDEICKCDAS